MNIIIKTTNTKQSCLNSIKSMEKIQNLRGTQTPHQHKKYGCRYTASTYVQRGKVTHLEKGKPNPQTQHVLFYQFLMRMTTNYTSIKICKQWNLQLAYTTTRKFSQTWQTSKKYLFTTVEQFRELAKLLGNTFSQKSNDFSQFRKYVIGKQTIKVLPVVYEIITMQTLNKTLTKNQPTPLNLLYKTVLYTKLNLLIIS
eukprot:TRINITY_DN1525_c0_g1_i2.p2 TRINITY_DN1525_c0_g1~~TRINITY_DN1525_c0_g1_i2.p2  ORF type:complete len:198 (+),score=-11.26 TRINITY_DN1525_c0_g1_i2:670-1263(+)